MRVTPYELFCRIDVEDNGIGISEEEQAKVFGRFYRGMEVSGEEGVGIGLYLVRQIISRRGRLSEGDFKTRRGFGLFGIFGGGGWEKLWCRCRGGKGMRENKKTAIRRYIKDIELHLLEEEVVDEIRSFLDGKNLIKPYGGRNIAFVQIIGAQTTGWGRI